jgi:dephospho-CoA kinase
MAHGAKDSAAGNGCPVPFSAKPVIGLVGGIGSGKSQVAAAFARRGGRIVAGDELAHAALRQPELRQRIVARWGPEILDAHGEVQRRRLGAIVFADAVERRALEEVLHPWIKQRIREEVAAARADPAVRFVVLDAAVMLEAGWDGVCDRLVYIDAPRAVRQDRLAAQRGWTSQEADDRERAQLPLTEKAGRADHVLDNATTLDHLERQVDHLLDLWGLAHSSEQADGRGGASSLDNFTLGTL